MNIREANAEDIELITNLGVGTKLINTVGNYAYIKSVDILVIRKLYQMFQVNKLSMKEV